MSVPAGSSLYSGSVSHRRSAPVGHSFRYPVYQAFLDLDELRELERRIPFFSYNGWNLTSFYDRDHFGTREAPIREKLAEWLAARGKAIPGKVFLLTNLRVAGYVFNPVSYFYLYDSEGRLAFAVAEINNTFGESFAYLLPGVEGAAGNGDETIRARFPKRFHVSPFISMQADYEFTLTPPGEFVRIGIEEFQEGAKFFEASFAGRQSPLTRGSLARALLLHPHLPLRVITWIHWEALRLWLKRVPFFTKPEPPVEALTRRGS